MSLQTSDLAMKLKLTCFQKGNMVSFSVLLKKIYL